MGVRSKRGQSSSRIGIPVWSGAIRRRDDNGCGRSARVGRRVRGEIPVRSGAIHNIADGTGAGGQPAGGGMGNGHP